MPACVCQPDLGEGEIGAKGNSGSKMYVFSLLNTLSWQRLHCFCIFISRFCMAFSDLARYDAHRYKHGWSGIGQHVTAPLAVVFAGVLWKVHGGQV